MKNQNDEQTSRKKIAWLLLLLLLVLVVGYAVTGPHGSRQKVNVATTSISQVSTSSKATTSKTETRMSPLMGTSSTRYTGYGVGGSREGYSYEGKLVPAVTSGTQGSLVAVSGTLGTAGSDGNRSMSPFPTGSGSGIPPGYVLGGGGSGGGGSGSTSGGDSSPVSTPVPTYIPTYVFPGALLLGTSTLRASSSVLHMQVTGIASGTLGVYLNSSWFATVTIPTISDILIPYATGTNVLQLFATSDTGVTSSSSYSVIRETSPYQVSYSFTGATTSDTGVLTSTSSTLTLFATATHPGSFSVFVNGVLAASGTIPLSEALAITYPLGTSTIVVYATSTIGATSSITYTIVRTAVPYQVSYTFGTGTTTGSTVTLLGGTTTVLARASTTGEVSMYVNGVFVASSTVPATFTTPALDSTYTITFYATSTTGATSTVTYTVQKYFVDTTAPSLPAVTSPLQGGSYNATATLVTGTSEPQATVYAYIDGLLYCSAIVNASGTFSCVGTSTLTAGSHTLTVTATDQAGNISGTTTVTFTRSNRIPLSLVRIFIPGDIASNIKLVNFTLTATSTSPAVVRLVDAFDVHTGLTGSFAIIASETNKILALGSILCRDHFGTMACEVSIKPEDMSSSDTDGVPGVLPGRYAVTLFANPLSIPSTCVVGGSSSCTASSPTVLNLESFIFEVTGTSTVTVLQ